jgi:hypothetical protein
LAQTGLTQIDAIMRAYQGAVPGAGIAVLR